MAYDFPTSPSVGQSYQGYTWDGEKWTVQASGGIIRRFMYVATAGQTTFSGADVASNTLAYLLGALEVIINGIVISPPNYTASNGTSVVLGAACAAGDLVYIQAYSNFSVLDALQKTLNGSDIPNTNTFRTNLGLGPYATAVAGQLIGASTNTPPATGNIAERLTVAHGVASLTTGAPAQAGFLDLTAGVWDLYADNAFAGPGATSSSDWWTAISTVSATVSAGVVGVVHNRRPAGTDIAECHSIANKRVFLSSTVRHYVNAQASFTVSTYACSGSFSAVRVN